ncbi:hypothetical protein [Devosia epidermidihirudinis]|uniref:hypothetical protein n=1 Tax=Devosia epidermidihirudinis TaxID=1293439 RepID=UPI0006982700|nr:hypothetical protein [Devosia epidermidihirudinis]
MDTLSPAPTLAIFASDKGPGDAERASIMSQVGTHFAKRGARIICIAEKGVVPVPLITAARASGGNVLIVADSPLVLPPALAGVPFEVFGTAAERQARVAELAEGYVALPGSLASVTALFNTWASGRAAGRTVPVVMLNRHRAYEVIRGYAADVLAPGLRGYEHVVQFAESIDDLWNRVTRLVSEAR